MNRKHLMNWLRASLALQQICEIDGCTGKAEYCIIRFHGTSIRVCEEHFPAKPSGNLGDRNVCRVNK